MRKAGVHVALLRGVNVGGANRLAMKDLKAIFERAGCVEIETIIQSGNVVFEAPPKIIAALPSAIAAQIRSQFDLETSVVLRSGAELRATVEANPFVRGGVAEAELHLMCLAAVPAPRDVAALNPRRSPPDEFIVAGQDVYLRLPNGVARSKLTNVYFDKMLKTIGTSRNWRTLAKLCAAAAR